MRRWLVPSLLMPGAIDGIQSWLAFSCPCMRKCQFCIVTVLKTLHYPEWRHIRLTNPVSEAFLGESSHSANLKGQCLTKDQISIRPTNKKKEEQLRFLRKHDAGAWNRFTLPLIAAFKWKFSLYQQIQLIQVFIISDFRWIRITVLFSNRFSMQMR